MRELIVNQNDAGQRLDKFLTKAVPLLPQSLLYKSIRTKRIKRNGKRCAISDRLQPGDVISLYLSDDLFGGDSQAPAFLAAPSRLDIVYEDENILLVDKRPGLIVHEDSGHQVDTLINRILHYLYQKGEYDPAQEQSFVPSLCNRIDLNTGGIVIAAKNAPALRVLNEKIRLHQVQKFYLCLVHGTPSPRQAGPVPGKEEACPLPKVKRGDTVAHPKFGRGRVRSLDKAKKHLRVVFAQGGEKTFLYPDAFQRGYLRLEREPS